MSAHGAEAHISHEDLAKIARIVLQYLEKNKAYKTDGLLRIADADATLVALMNDLIKTKDTPLAIHKQLAKTKAGKKDLNPHSYVGVLKRAILQSGKNAFVSDSKSWAQLRTTLQNTDFENPEQVNACIKTFNLALSNLAHSAKAQDRNAAETIYTMLHIATKISQNAEFNRMHPNNCAIVVGPGMGELLSPPQATDPIAMVSLMQRSNNLAEALISSGSYALPFKDAAQYFGFTPKQILQTHDSIRKMMTALTEKFRTEMENGPNADQAKIGQYNQTLQDLSRRKGILERLGTPIAASSALDDTHATQPSSSSSSSERRTSPIGASLSEKGTPKRERPVTPPGERSLQRDAKSPKRDDESPQTPRRRN